MPFVAILVLGSARHRSVLSQNCVQHAAAGARPAGEDKPRRRARGLRVRGADSRRDGPRQRLQGELLSMVSLSFGGGDEGNTSETFCR